MGGMDHGAAGRGVEAPGIMARMADTRIIIINHGTVATHTTAELTLIMVEQVPTIMAITTLTTTGINIMVPLTRARLIHTMVATVFTLTHHAQRRRQPIKKRQLKSNKYYSAFICVS